MRADERDLEPEWAELELRLQGFRPGPLRLDRDRMMYLAGRAAAESERRRGGAGAWGQRVWPAAFGAMTVVAANLLLALVTQRQADPSRPSPDGRPAVATTAVGPDDVEPPPPHSPGDLRLAAPQREARVSGNDSVLPSALPVGSRLNEFAPSVEQAPAPAARSLRFRGPDDWDRMLGRRASGAISQPPPGDGEEPTSGLTAELPRRLDEFQRLTCLDYRRVLLQELTRSPPGSAVPSSTPKPSGHES
jgi:hypothetical protein